MTRSVPRPPRPARWLVAAAVAWALVGCADRPAPPDRSATPSVAAGGAGAEPEPERAARGGAASCDGLRLVGPTAPGGEDGPAPDPLLPGTERGYYVQAPEAPGAPVFSLRPLLERSAGDSDPLPDEIDPAWDQPRFTVEVTPGYRLDGAPCDRIGVVDLWGHPEHAVEAFGTPGADGRTLALVDSVGRPVAVLPALGASVPSPAPSAERTPPRPRLKFDAGGPALVAGAGRLPLGDVFPHGRWHARPAGVRYRGSDLVLVNACVPHDAADGFCGLESEDGRLIADPPSPLVASVGVRLVGDRVRVEPFVVHGYWGGVALDLGSPYPYAWDGDPVAPRSYPLR